jgi:hypothetical protein
MSSDLRVFVTQTGQRSGSADAILQILKQSGRPIVIDTDVDLPAGRPWRQALEERMDAAQAAVVFLTPDLYRSHRITGELGTLFKRTEEDPGFLVVPVLLEPTDPPGFLKGRQYLDARHASPADVAGRIADVLERRAIREDAPRFPGAGRTEYLERLEQIHRAATSGDLFQDIPVDDERLG